MHLYWKVGQSGRSWTQFRNVRLPTVAAARHHRRSSHRLRAGAGKDVLRVVQYLVKEDLHCIHPGSLTKVSELTDDRLCELVVVCADAPRLHGRSFPPQHPGDKCTPRTGRPAQRHRSYQCGYSSAGSAEPSRRCHASQLQLSALATPMGQETPVPPRPQ